MGLLAGKVFGAEGVVLRREVSLLGCEGAEERMKGRKERQNIYLALFKEAQSFAPFGLGALFVGATFNDFFETTHF